MNQTQFNPKDYIGRRFRYNHLCCDNDIQVVDYIEGYMIVDHIDYHNSGKLKGNCYKIKIEEFQRLLDPYIEYRNLKEIDEQRHNII